MSKKAEKIIRGKAKELLLKYSPEMAIAFCENMINTANAFHDKEGVKLWGLVKEEIQNTPSTGK
jgi:hypothetical protein